ncbi:MAG: hypothetical protein M3214_04435, partial [Actinomycetota bacterium]|nr:hypothetical protein [Actinomycetota bacterium]
MSHQDDPGRVLPTPKIERPPERTPRWGNSRAVLAVAGVVVLAIAGALVLLSTRDEGGDDERARSASSESSATQPAGRIAYLSGPVPSASLYVVDAAEGEPEKVLDT